MSDTDTQPNPATTEDEKPTDPPAAVDDQDVTPTEDDKLADAQAKADKYARALFTERVAATGRLADPTDAPFNADLLQSAEALTAALDALLAAKPHLASRKPAWGDVGAGQTRTGDRVPDWADLFQSS